MVPATVTANSSFITLNTGTFVFIPSIAKIWVEDATLYIEVFDVKDLIVEVYVSPADAQAALAQYKFLLDAYHENGVTAGGAGTGFIAATTGGVVIVGTLDSNGLSMGVPNYLTTAMASDNGSAFVAASAVFAGTNALGTIASDGISISVAPGGGGAGTGFTSASTAGSDIVGTLDSNGISLGIPKYLTTAATGGGLSAINVSAGSTSSNVSAVTFSNGSGVSFGFDGSNVTASVQTNYQTPGAYLTTAALSQDSSKYAGTSTGIAGGSVTLNTAGISISLPAYLTTAQPPGAYLTTAMASDASSAFAGTGATIAGGSMTVNTAGVNISLPAYLTTFSYPRLDQVLDPTADKLFSMGSNQLQLSWATGGSFSTNATRHGFFELDLAGNLTQEADLIHAHQHGGAPTNLDLLHLEGDGANVTAIRVHASATVAAEINQPIKFTTADAGYAIGSVPMIIPATMSNSVANLNANFVQGRASSQLAGLGFTSASTAGTAVVATLSTNGLSMGVPAYLTAAAAGGMGLNTSVATTGGTDLAMTGNSSGLTIGYPKWITTYVNDLTSGRAGTNTSVATTSGTDITLGVNTSGVTIGYPKWITTYVNDLTSGRAGVNTAVSTTAGTDITLGVNTSGVTIGYPKWITTYVNDLTSGRAGVNTAVSTTAGTDITLGVNTSGVTIGYPKWITTYVNDLTSGRAGVNTAVSTTAGTDITLGVNTSGVTIGYPKWITTYVNDLTSGRAGINASVATTGGTDLAVTLNTSGLTLGYPKWITTAAQTGQTLGFSLGGNSATTGSSQISNGGYLLAGGANVTIQQNNNSISISAAAAAAAPINVSAGSTSQNIGSIVFADSNGISWGLGTGASSQSITATVAGGGGIALANTETTFPTGTVLLSVAGGALTITKSNSNQTFLFSVPATSSLVGAGLVSLSTNGSTITISGRGTTASYWCNADVDILATGASAISQFTGSSIWVQPFFLPYAISVGFVRFLGSFNDSAVGTGGTTQAATTFSCARYTTFALALYSQGVGASSRSIQYIGSTGNGWTGMTQFGAGAQGSRYTVTVAKSYPVSGTTSNYASNFAVSSASIVVSSNSNTLFTGPHYLDLNFATSLGPGNYWLALGISTSSASQSSNISFCSTNAMPISLCAVTATAMSWGVVGAATSASDHQLFAAQGAWTTNSTIMSTSSIGMDSVSQAASNPTLPFYFIRSA